jgi:DNA-binding NarL/FixJ family response regulator
MVKSGAACKAGSVSLRVLIVDDNDCFLAVARTVLEREGITVAGVASTAADALQEAEQLPLDVVLVDITLGEESGLDLARRLVEQGRDCERSVILISTHAESDFADLIAESPARGFLTKSQLSADAIRHMVDGHTG